MTGLSDEQVEQNREYNSDHRNQMNNFLVERRQVNEAQLESGSIYHEDDCVPLVDGRLLHSQERQSYRIDTYAGGNGRRLSSGQKVTINCR